MGLTQPTLIASNVNVYLTFTSTSSPSYVQPNILDEIINSNKYPDAIDELNSLKSSLESNELTALVANNRLNVYVISSKITKRTASVSAVTISFTPENDMSNVQIIEIIPKTIAPDIDYLKFFPAQIISLQRDPVVQWNVDQVKIGQSTELSYQVRGELTSIADSQSLIAGKISVSREAPLPDGTFKYYFSEDSTNYFYDSDGKLIDPVTLEGGAIGPEGDPKSKYKVYTFFIDKVRNTKVLAVVFDEPSTISKIEPMIYKPTITVSTDSYNENIGEDEVLSSSILKIYGSLGSFTGICHGVQGVCTDTVAKQCRNHVLYASCPKTPAGYRKVENNCAGFSNSPLVQGVKEAGKNLLTRAISEWVSGKVGLNPLTGLSTDEAVSGYYEYLGPDGNVETGNMITGMASIGEECVNDLDCDKPAKCMSSICVPEPPGAGLEPQLPQCRSSLPRCRTRDMFKNDGICMFDCGETFSGTCADPACSKFKFDWDAELDIALGTVGYEVAYGTRSSCVYTKYTTTQCVPFPKEGEYLPCPAGPKCFGRGLR